MNKNVIIVFICATIIHLCYSCNNCCNNCWRQPPCCNPRPCWPKDCNITTTTTTTTETTLIPPNKTESHHENHINIIANDSITNNIDINNTVQNTNVVRVPINLSITNINNIVVTRNPAKIVTTTTTSRTPTPTPQNITRSTTPVTKVVPIPIPIYVKVIWPIVISRPYPVPSGCCMVVNPCIGHQCNHGQINCGGGCTSSVMYEPRNPCEYGCHRRPYYFNYNCMQHGCQQRYFDCSSCRSDFYNSLSTYQSCVGCFF